MKEDLKVLGKVTIYLSDVKVQTIDNIVVTAGKNYIVSRMKDATVTTMSHIGIGSGSAYQNIANTALQTPLGTRVALTSTTVVGNAITYIATIPAGNGTGTVREAGIFNAATSGTLLARTTFDPIEKTSIDPLKIVWEITIV